MKNEYDFLNDVTVDFSMYEEKELTEKELKNMKNLIKNTKIKKIRLGRIAALAGCLAAVAVFSQTAFAKELAAKIIKSISTGHNEFAQVDPSGLEAEIPDELSGLFFDKNGNTVTRYSADTVLYDKDGNKITDVKEYLRDADIIGIEKTVDEDGNFTINFGEDSGDPLERLKSEGYEILSGDELDKLNNVLDFKPALPSTLPQGFTPHGAAYFADDGKYLFVYYTNSEGDYISVDERLLTEETAFAYTTDGEIEETTVDGHKAVLSDGRTLNWEDGDIAVGISTGDLISTDELMAMAESMER